MTRIEQTKHIKDEVKAITRAEVSEEALEAAVASEAVTVSAEVKAIADITYYLHVRRSVTSATS
jgi:phosphoribosyl-ATP pyrophosphohydrolase